MKYFADIIKNEVNKKVVKKKYYNLDENMTVWKNGRERIKIIKRLLAGRK